MPTKLTEDMVVARTKSSDLGTIKKFNCWGSELDDVTLIRRFKNVEVLSLSLNNITTLADFQFCSNLVELYVRRNDIRDLSEVCYLQELPRLRRLLLTENPCVETAGPLYRATVLRCLPHLEVLDTISVASEEVEDAMRNGLILEHPLARRERISPEPGYYGRESPIPQQIPPPSQVLRRSPQQPHYEYEEDSGSSYRTVNQSPPVEYFYQNQNGERESPLIGGRSPDALNTGVINQINQSLTKAGVTGGRRTSGNGSSSSPISSDSQASNSPPHSSTNGEIPLQRRISSPENGYAMREQVQMNGRRQSADYASDCIREQQYYESEQSQHNLRAAQLQRVPGNNNRSSKQRAKTSNLLSAVLCLIPELDSASLEVVELAVRRRMDELHSD